MAMASQLGRANPQLWIFIVLQRRTIIVGNPQLWIFVVLQRRTIIVGKIWSVRVSYQQRLAHPYFTPYIVPLQKGHDISNRERSPL